MERRDRNIIAKASASLGGYTIGILVQTNFGGVLSIDGVPVGVELGKYYLKELSETTPATPTPPSRRELA
jgi:hypothetical protein